MIHFATETGGLLLDGMGDGICLGYKPEAAVEQPQVKGRTYLPVKDIYQFTNNTAFSILQLAPYLLSHLQQLLVHILSKEITVKRKEFGADL